MIFVDAGAWVALMIPDGRHGGPAREFYREVSRGAHGAMVTTDFVLDEAATLIRVEADVETACRFLRTVLQAPSVSLVWIAREHFRYALEMLEQQGDRRWSFTDCTSSVVMRDLGMAEAFTFDRNFEQAGFSRLP